MAATRVANVIELTADGDTLKDIFTNIGDIAGLSFKKMFLSCSVAGNLTLETDRGADTVFATLHLGVGLTPVDGPLNFPDGLKIGASVPTGFKMQLFL